MDPNTHTDKINKQYEQIDHAKYQIDDDNKNLYDLNGKLSTFLKHRMVIFRARAIEVEEANQRLANFKAMKKEQAEEEEAMKKKEAEALKAMKKEEEEAKKKEEAEAKAEAKALEAKAKALEAKANEEQQEAREDKGDKDEEEDPNSSDTFEEEDGDEDDGDEEDDKGDENMINPGNDYKDVALSAEDQKEHDKFANMDVFDDERRDGRRNEETQEFEDARIIGNDEMDQFAFSLAQEEAKNLKVRKQAQAGLAAREFLQAQKPQEPQEAQVEPQKKAQPPRPNEFLAKKEKFLEKNDRVHGLSSSDSGSDSGSGSDKEFFGKLKFRDRSYKLGKSAQRLREKVYKYEQESGSEQELKDIMKLLRKIRIRSMNLFKEIKRQGRKILDIGDNKEVVRTIFAIQSNDDDLFRRGHQFMSQREGKIPMNNEIIGTNKTIQQEARDIFVEWHKLLGRFRPKPSQTAKASQLYEYEFGRQWYEEVVASLAKKKYNKKIKKTFAQKISPEPEKKRLQTDLGSMARNLIDQLDQTDKNKLVEKQTDKNKLVEKWNKEEVEEEEEDEKTDDAEYRSINFRF